MTEREGRRATAGWVGLAIAAFALPSCFLDMPWSASRRSQRAALENATPETLRATPASRSPHAPATKVQRTLKLRAYATPRYAAEVTNWPRQLAAMIDDANNVLGPTLGVRIEIIQAKPWSPRASDDNLSALCDELASTDPAQDIDWAVGFAGSVPRFEASFHQLGLGTMMSKYFVMRAMNDAREYETIERELSQIDTKERMKLYHARKRHKTATVFLHEVAHTLGVIHEPDVRTIMHSRYGAQEEGFSSAAVGLMRMTLEHRRAPAAQTEQAFAKALLDHLALTSSSWVPKEREQMVARLENTVASTAQPTAAPTEKQTPAVVRGSPPPELAASDQSTFERAVQDQRASHLRDAWSKAKPLFTAYPNVYAVQDFRCHLAMQLGLTWEEVQLQCERLTQLTEGQLDSAKHK